MMVRDVHIPSVKGSLHAYVSEESEKHMMGDLEEILLYAFRKVGQWNESELLGLILLWLS